MNSKNFILIALLAAVVMQVLVVGIVHADVSNFTSNVSQNSTGNVNPNLIIGGGGGGGGGSISLGSGPQPSTQKLDKGQTAIITQATPTGGTPPYTYQWYSSTNVLASPKATTLCSAPKTLTCTFVTNTLTTPNVYYLLIKATDSSSNYANSSFATVAVYSTPTSAIAASRNAIDVGQNVSITDQIEYGIGPFTSNFTAANKIVANEVEGVSSGGTATFKFIGTSTGTYTFNAVATDGGTTQAFAVSSPGVVTITVDPSFNNSDVSLIVSSYNVTVGQSETVTANAFGGLGPYTYSWKENGNTVTGTANQLLYAATVAGSNTIQVTVTDHNGAQITGNVILSVKAQPSTPTLSVSNTPTVDYGQYETLFAYVAGGQVPYTYNFIVYNSVTNAVLSSSIQSTNTFTFAVPYSGNTISAIVYVTDSSSTPITKASAPIAAVRINPAFVSGSPLLSTTSPTVSVGQNDIITANVLGGTQPYTYTWTENGNAISGNSPITFTPSTPGTYTFNVTITDAAGAQIKGSVAITVNAALKTPTLSASNTPTVDYGQYETLSAYASGGQTPYTYNFVVYNSVTNVVMVNAVQSSNTFTFAVPYAGNTIYAKVFVTDSSAAPVTANSVLTQTIRVDPAFVSGSPLLTVSSSSVDIGQNSIITVNVIGGTLPYTYVWTENGNAISGNSPITFTPSTPGTYTFNVIITDKDGAQIEGSTVITVNGALSTPTLSVSNTPNVDYGQYETLSSYAIGGASPYTYNFVVYNSVTGKILLNSMQASNTFTFAAPYTGNTVYAKVFVTDSSTPTPATANSIPTSIFTVGPAFVSGSPLLTVTNSVIDIGQNDIITANAIGGTQPYTYTWTENGNAISGNSPITFTPSVPGTYTFNVIITDRTGAQITGSVVVTVNGALEFGAPSLALAYNALDLGQNETVSANVLGGTQPYSFAWTIGGSPVAGNTAQITFFGNVLGANMISVMVTDSNHQTASASANVVVYADPSVTFAASNSSLSIGQNETLSANVFNGEGPFSIMFTYSNGTVANTVTGVTYNGFATYTFTAVAGGTTPTFNAVVDDEGTGLAFNSIQIAIPIAAAPTPPSSGGGGTGGSGGTGGGGGGGGGGSSLPVLSRIGECVLITNVTQLNQVNFQLNNRTFNLVENFITPTTTGVTINGGSYTLNAGVPVSFSDSGNNYTAELENLSYVPIQQTVSLNICSTNNNQILAQPNTTSTGTGVGGSGGSGVLNVTVTTKNLTVAPGAPISLVVSVIGRPGNLTYQWYNGTSGMPFLMPKQIYPSYNATAGVAPGTFIYYAIVNGLNGTIGRSANIIVTVAAKPSTNTGASSTAVAKPSLFAMILSWWPWILLLLLILLLIWFILAKRRKKKEAMEATAAVTPITPELE